MFRAYPHAVRTLGLLALDRGCLSLLRSRASQLLRQGWHVRLLCLDPAFTRAFPDLPTQLLNLDQLPCPYQISNIHHQDSLALSDRLRLVLQLHTDLDALEFPLRKGLAFRSIQAKRAGLAFHRVSLFVRADEPSSSPSSWPCQLDDLECAYAERYSFEQACVSLVATEAVRRDLLAQGWSLGPRVISLDEELPALQPCPEPPSTQPLVTVCVPYFHHARYLPATLAALAAQSYAPCEVLVIDDGSTDPSARLVFDQMQARYPQFRFLRQPNAGIGATRNRGLAEANGTFFVPFDADNLPHPHMLTTFVQAIQRRPDVAALSCYFLAFTHDEDLQKGTFCYAYRPTAGPHLLASLRNIYGDATAIYRTEAFRAVGGYETDRGTSFEDWEAFVKLAHAGYRLDVIPEHLFYYRHLPSGFSRRTNPWANHERVLRQFRQRESLPASEHALLWGLLASLHQRSTELEVRQLSLRYRLADRLRALCSKVPGADQFLHWLALRTRSSLVRN